MSYWCTKPRGEDGWKMTLVLGSILLMVMPVSLLVGAHGPSLTPVGVAGTGLGHSPVSSSQDRAALPATSPTARPYATPVSPHPGTVDNYEDAPAALSEDPAIDYDSVGAEPILNVYQALISDNGSLAGPYPGDFVPNLATCVPGSAQCTQLYGNTLVSGDNYTFVLDPTAKFYNPSTGTLSAVFPVDVVFSIARDCLFSTFPFGNPGWILCQALLPFGNSAYDGGMHAPYNSTPANILRAVTMNNSAYCPAVATEGCVTFDTEYSGQFWPDFLEFVADPLGGSILSCRYATSVGGGLPGLACGATTDPSGIADTAWDSYQLGMGATGTDYQGTNATPVAAWATTLRWSLVGSGPYYMSSLTPNASYVLKANPGWAGTTCSWAGCIPATFAITQVNTVYESSAVQGETALESGQADIATIPPTDYSSVLLPLLQSGKVSRTQSPSLSIFFTNFDMSFSQSGAQGYLPAGTTLNAPSDLFQDLAFRQFLEHALPYQTVQSQYNSVDGIPLNELMGGAIPRGMGNYYPTNISWPQQNPTVAPPSSPDSAVYWWNQVEGEKGIAASACTSAKPCVFPFVSYSDDPLQDQINGAWAATVSNLSQGAVDLIPVDTSFYNLVVGSFSSPGSSPFPMYELGWAPDYPDPTDFVAPMYQSDNMYTSGDALCEGLMGSGCASASLASANYDNPCPTHYVWSNDSVTESCQGTAYQTLNLLLAQAAYDTNLNERVLLYNAAEHIAEQLGIIVANPGQQVDEMVAASWVNASSLNVNPMIGGAGESTWYTLRYLTSPQLTYVAVTPPSASVLSGSSVSLSAAATCSGGPCPSPVTYAWTQTAPSVGTLNSTTGSSVLFTGSAAGNDTLVVNATMGGRNVSGAPVSIQVTSSSPQLTYVAVTPPSANLSAGSSVSLSAAATCSGGLCPSPVTYAWTQTAPSVGTLNSTTGSSVLFTGSVAGNDTLVVHATMGGGTLSSAPVSIRVTSSSTQSLISVGSSPTSANLTAGQSTTFTAIPACSGGACASPVTYVWTQSDPALGTLNRSTGASVSFLAGPSAGTDQLTVNATMGPTTVHSGAIPVVITLPPPPTLSAVSVTPASSTPSTGGTVVFSATPTCSGGSCPAGTTYSWSLSNVLGTLNSSTGSSVAFTAGPAAGRATLFVNATLGGVTRQGTPVPITILTPAPVLTSVTLTPGSATVTAGGTEELNVTATCSGPCPAGIVYSWSRSNSVGALGSTSGATVTFRAGNTSGTDVITVTATLHGVSKFASSTLTVTAGKTTPPGNSPSGIPLGYILLAVAAGAVAVAAVGVVIYRKRGRRNMPAALPSPPPPPPPPPPAPPFRT